MDYFKRLETLMARLRAKRGCPWDRRQTHQSLLPYLLEEAHEVLEAIESRNARHLKEELGDLLLQVVFHAQIEKEKGRFDLRDVAKTIGDKLLRRHPHVFGKDRFRSIPHLKRRWEELKHAEKPHRKSISDGVPETLPSLLRAQRIHEKITRRERPYSDRQLDKELARAWQAWGKARLSRRRRAMEKAAGEFLLSFARLCQASGVHSEMALRRSLHLYEEQYRRKKGGSA
jgi:tetrapyrrole methylase family protein/MazG family protein